MFALDADQDQGGRSNWMAEQSQTAELMLMQDMGFTEEGIERRRRLVGLDPRDVERIMAIKPIVVRNGNEHVARFFDYLASLDEARPLFAKPEVAERARRLKAEHVIAMVGGKYGVEYVQQRIELGLIYGRAGIEIHVFLGAFDHLLKSIGDSVMKQFHDAPEEGFESFMSLKKVAFFDVGIIVDVLVFERERVIRQQQEAIRELSTPVLQMRDRLLILPIIGVLDTHRARLLTDALLRAIRANRAKVVVVDITGVGAVDSKVANHLLQAVTAAKLMGAAVIVTGLSSEVAQTLVTLGVDLSRLNTIGDLQGGIEEAERILGYTTVPGAPPAANGHNGHSASVAPESA
jgi:rsbT co-antagonist protein RsbR